MSASTINRLKGTGLNQINLPTLSPEQMNLFNMLMGGSQRGISSGLEHLSNLAGGGNEAMWRQLEAPAMRQFGQLAGGLASRFSGMGSGARRSSGFQHAMGGAGADLAERLASQRMGLQNQAIQELLGMGKTLLGTNLTESFLTPKPKPLWQQLTEPLLGGLGTAVGRGLGGGWF